MSRLEGRQPTRRHDGGADVNAHIWLQSVQRGLRAKLPEITRDPRWGAEPTEAAPREKPDTRVAGVGFVERLKTRKVVQWVLGYLAMVWVVLQLNDVLADIWGVPLTAQKVISLGLGLGVFPALVISWYHGEKGRQRVCCSEIGLVALVTGVAIATVWRVCFS